MSDINLKTASIELGDLKFTTQQFAAMHGLGVMVNLVRLLGPTIATLLGADQKSDLSTLAPQLSAALGVLKPEDMKNLVSAMLEETTVVLNGSFVQLNSTERIDRVFSGKLQHLFKVFAHSIEVNYGDFFAEVLRASQAPGDQAEIITAGLA